jgi:hypothetical protein
MGWNLFVLELEAEYELLFLKLGKLVELIFARLYLTF